MAGESVSFQITGDNSSFIQAIQESQAAAVAAVNMIGSSVSGINDAFASVMASVSGLGSLLAGGVIAEGFKRIAEGANEIFNSSMALGLSTDQVQAMGAAADESGAKADRFNHAVEKLSDLLKDARDGSTTAITSLSALGITAGDISSKTFNLADLLQVLHERLNDSGTAAQTTSALTRELGQRMADLVVVFKALSMGADDVADKDRTINALTNEQITRLHVATGGWGEFFDAIGHGFEKGYVGILRFNDAVGEQLGDAVDRVKSAAAGAEDALASLGGPISVAVVAGLRAQGQAQQGLTDVVAQGQRMITLATLETWHEQVRGAQTGSAEQVALARDYYHQVLQFYGGNTLVPAVQQAFNEMTNAQRAYTKNSEEMDKDAQSVSVWLFNQDIAWAREASAAKIAADKAAAAQHDALAKAELDATIVNIRARETATQDAYKRGTVGPQQEYKELLQAYQDELLAQMIYLQTKEANARGDLVQMAQIAAQEAAVQAAYLNNVQKLQGGLAQNWTNTLNQMTNQFSSETSKILMGQTTFAAGMKSIASSMVSSMIESLVKLGVQYVVNAALAKATGTSAARTNMMANAAQAASGAYASASQIPYVGWILGPIAAAAAYTGAMAFPIASAAGGFNVPAGVNPVTQLHENEMVLPQEHADAVRDMTGGGGTTVVNMKGFRSGNMFTMHGDDLVDAITALTRNGKLRMT